MRRKANSTKRLIWLLGGVILLAACSPQQEVGNPTASIIPATLLIPTFTPTASLTTTPTNTTLPSNTPTFTPSPTFVPVPTIPVFEQETYLIELIGSNGGCVLPCWWSIEPGKSNWQGLSVALEYLRSPVNIESTGDEYYYLSVFAVNQIREPNLFVNFFGSEDRINIIKITANLYLPGDPRNIPVFVSAMNRYSIAMILEQFGIPSRVLLDLPKGQSHLGGITYKLWIFYEESGILVEYILERGLIIDDQADKITICPTIERTTWLKLYLRNSDDDTRMSNVAQLVPPPILRNLNNVTNLTEEDFYYLFLDPEQTACFESQISKW